MKFKSCGQKFDIQNEDFLKDLSTCFSVAIFCNLYNTLKSKDYFLTLSTHEKSIIFFMKKSLFLQKKIKNTHGLLSCSYKGKRKPDLLGLHFSALFDKEQKENTLTLDKEAFNLTTLQIQKANVLKKANIEIARAAGLLKTHKTPSKALKNPQLPPKITVLSNTHNNALRYDVSIHEDYTYSDANWSPTDSSLC